MGKSRIKEEAALVPDEQQAFPLLTDDNGQYIENVAPTVPPTEEAESLYTSVGIRRDMMAFVDRFAKANGMQKRDVVTALLIGLALSDDKINEAVFQFGRLGATVLHGENDIASAITEGFPASHPLHGANLRLSVERLCGG